MDGVFINYRRSDSAPYAGRLFDFLCRSLPNQRIFMDIDAIDPGEDFIDAINKTLQASKVVLAIIGEEWLDTTDAAGKRRLDDPDDYVVRELSRAFESNARVIPILVGGATMPKTEALPPALAALARRNAFELSDTRFSSDAERLAEVIERQFESGKTIDRKAAQAQKPQAAVHPETSAIEVSAEASATTLKTALWIAFGFDVLFVLVNAGNSGGAEVEVFAGGALVLGLFVWLNLMVLRWKNWARITYLVFTGFSFFNVFLSDEAEAGISVIGFALSVWAVWLMYSRPRSNFFDQAKAAVR